MLKYRFNLLPLMGFISILLVSSCQTEYHTQFNKDFSGSQTITIDLSEMMGFLGESQEGGEIMNEDTLRMIADTLSRAFVGTGADNFSVDVSETDNLLSIGFDFAGIETFDNIARAIEDEALGQGASIDGEAVFGLFGSSFEREGKWLTIPLGESAMVREMADALSEEEEEDTNEGESMEEENGMASMLGGMMGGAMTIKHKFSFARKIKKIKADVPYVVDGKSLIVEYSIDDYIKWQDEGKKSELQVKVR